MLPQSPSDTSNRYLILSAHDAVRKRPGMYIGGTDTHSLYHLIYVLMDHFVEEALLRRCSHITLTLQNDEAVSIFGNTAGIPIDQYKDTSDTKLEAIMQGFVRKEEFEPNVYYVTGGLHGLGLAPINMLCAEMIVENGRDGVLWRKVYHEGIPQTPLERIGEALPDQQGTRFTFKPDPTIFDHVVFDRQMLIKRCKEVAYQISNLRITFSDQRNGENFEDSFFAVDGLETMVLDLNAGQQALHEPIHIQQDITIRKNDGKELPVGIEIAFQFTTGTQSYLLGYSNTVETPDGGPHLAALKASILSVLNAYIDRFDYRYKRTKEFSWKEVASGLSAAIVVRHSEPKFESPTRLILGNHEIYGPVAGLVYETFYPEWEVVEAVVDHYLARRKQSRKKRTTTE